MPKIIKNLRKEILEKSKVLLEKNGFESFTIRAVAKECGIAVGTVYNYFPSKENLVANIMLDGWEDLIDMITRKAERSFNCSISLKVIFGYLCEYRNMFKESWSGFAISPEIQMEHQNLLKDGLSKLIHSTLLYFGANMSPDPTDFISEILIFEAAKDEINYDDIQPFIDRIIKL